MYISYYITNLRIKFIYIRIDRFNLTVYNLMDQVFYFLFLLLTDIHISYDKILKATRI